jgi:hypothetical protein
MEQVLRLTLLELDRKPVRVSMTRTPRGWISDPQNLPLSVTKRGPDGPLTMIIARASDEEFRFYWDEGDGPVHFSSGYQPEAAGRKTCEIFIRSWSIHSAGEAYFFVDNIAVSRAEYALTELSKARKHPLVDATASREIARHLVLPIRRAAIKTEETRRLQYTLTIPDIGEEPGMLSVGINHGYDNHGDQGLYLRVLDAEGKVLRDAYSGSKDWWRWMGEPARSGDTFTVEVVDEDTLIEGEFAGNVAWVGAWFARSGSRVRPLPARLLGRFQQNLSRQLRAVASAPTETAK